LSSTLEIGVPTETFSQELGNKDRGEAVKVAELE
jgi:hypothetical protein